METNLEGPNQPPLSCGKPKYIVVLLHGAGASGDEVIDLALEWAPSLGKAEFLAPHAPWLSVSAGKGRQWVSPASDARLPGHSMEHAAERLNAFIDAALAKRKLDDGQLALVGFAQGATLALYAGLRRTKALGAIVAIAAGIDEGHDELGEFRSKPPVLLVEANLEPKPEPEALAKAERTLSEQGISVQRLAKPGDYLGLDDEGLSMIAAYLHDALVQPDSDEHHHH